jgi:hypothetical protein
MGIVKYTKPTGQLVQDPGGPPISSIRTSSDRCNFLFFFTFASDTGRGCQYFE